MVAAVNLKRTKIEISRQWFDRSLRNLARWRSSALLTVWSVPNLRFKEIEDGGGRHPNNIKITISRQWFDRSAQHLAYNDVYWSSEPGVLFTKVRTAVSVRKFCVRKFLRTCVTLFTKLRTETGVRTFVNSTPYSEDQYASLYAKCCADRSNRCRDISILVLFNLTAANILDF